MTATTPACSWMAICPIFRPTAGRGVAALRTAREDSAFVFSLIRLRQAISSDEDAVIEAAVCD
jgi:hypothetical protein